jgi:hypothetical protein
MHVDGAVVANLFYTGGVFSFSGARGGVGRGEGREDIYIVHNGQLSPVASETSRRLRSIALRAFESAAKAATHGDLFRTYVVALRESAGFRWITIPEGVELSGDETFDPVVMMQSTTSASRRRSRGRRGRPNRRARTGARRHEARTGACRQLRAGPAAMRVITRGLVVRKVSSMRSLSISPSRAPALRLIA